MGRARGGEEKPAASRRATTMPSRLGVPFSELSSQDLRVIARHPVEVRAALARRGPGAAAALDELLLVDAQRRRALSKAEVLRAERNRRKPHGRPSDEQRAELKALAQACESADAEVAPLQVRVDEILLALPNIVAPDVPDRVEVVRIVGDTSKTGAEHTELAGGWIDSEAGVKLSGARFAYLKGPLVRLQTALTQYALDVLEEEGFMPVICPVLVHEQALVGTGFLPDAEGQVYQLAEGGLYLTGTSEVALASLHADEILAAERLPLRYAGLSTCFRREAGAAGRDTSGIFRMHQFDKIEMFSFVAPGDAAAEHERILRVEERLLSGLGIPYRVVSIPADDLGASAAKKYDYEAWLPGQGRYRELTSCSNTTDYQARRLRIRAKDTDGTVGAVHTLNGTAFAIGRTIIALLENGQDSEGVVHVPGTLVRYGAPSRIERPQP